jgi:hypothetical protein
VKSDKSGHYPDMAIPQYGRQESTRFPTLTFLLWGVVTWLAILLVALLALS